MNWAAPWAWGLVLAALLPVVAHLWSHHRPTPRPFPTLRFLRATSPVSRRLRSLSDWPMLVLRLGIVTAISAAAAGPTLVSAWRQDAWRARLHRVIVVDDAVGARASTLVAAEQRGVTSSAVFDGDPVGERLGDAIADATHRAQRMRAELVVVWDGSRASLSPADLTDIPRAVGLRLLPVEGEAGPRAGGPASDTRAMPVTIRADGADGARRDRLLALLPRLPGATGGWGLDIRWPGATPVGPTTTAPAAVALRRVLDEVADDPRVRDAAERSARDRRSTTADAPRAEGRRLARAREGTSLLRGWAEGDRLVLALDAEPSSPLAWWSAVSALESLARPWNAAAPDARWSAAELAGSRRDPAFPPSASLPGGLDTRGAWAMALALLLVEEWRRGRKPAPPVGEVTDAS